MNGGTRSSFASDGLLLLAAQSSEEYELLDSGEQEKLERYGEFVLRRPDPQALWGKMLPAQRWDEADASFLRQNEAAGWRFRRQLPERWAAEHGGVRFWVKPAPFKHTGVFPEHAPNWQWLRERLAGVSGGQPSVLNLFGYTGGATLAMAQAGAAVCHLDGSKSAVAWARENAEINGMSDRPVRWIVDDARDFVRREVKRARRYDGIVLDPPAFGHGPKGQVWKIEDHFVELLHLCVRLLNDTPRFILINGYASGYSAIAYRNNLLPLLGRLGGRVEAGELTITETSESARLLPCGIFARWSPAE